MFRELKLPVFLAITYAYPECGARNLKPDLILYPTSQPGMPCPDASYYLKKVKHKAKEHHGHTAWASAVAIIEVKTNPKLAPFTFGDKPFAVTLKDQPPRNATSPPDGRNTRAQMSIYVKEVHVCQHRCFLFTAFIQEQYVCFMRWDRTGAIVSESHDWAENPKSLLKFFWCLAKCSDEEQGYDFTATPVGNLLPSRTLTRRLKELEKKYESNKWITKYIKEATEDTKKYPWVKVSSCVSSSGVAQTHHLPSFSRSHVRTLTILPCSVSTMLRGIMQVLDPPLAVAGRKATSGLALTRCGSCSSRASGMQKALAPSWRTMRCFVTIEYRMLPPFSQEATWEARCHRRLIIKIFFRMTRGRRRSVSTIALL